MEVNKDLNEWRAEKLGYVYFSRLSDLIINESKPDSIFDFLIDIGENHRETGRYFAVEVKAYNNKLSSDDLLGNGYENIAIPLLLVMFDNSNDHGYYKWIKKPEDNGKLVLDKSEEDVAELNNESLRTIVTQIKDWYSNKNIA